MAKKERQGIEAQLGVETVVTLEGDDIINASDYEQGIQIINSHNVGEFAPISSDPSILGQPIVKLAQPIKQPEKIEHSFYTEVKEDLARKKEVSSPIAEQPKKPLINNINLGEISTSVLETIKYPAVVRAYFYALELSICYQLNRNDTLETALSTLRDAIFAAQYDKPLPKDAYIQSARSLNAGSAYALQHSIDRNQGFIDATIQAYDCSE